MTRTAPRRLASVAALWCVWIALTAAQARERVAFVSLVARDTGAPVAALTPSDIVIREDRVAREVLRITPATGAMPIAILVDNSEAADRSVLDLRTAVTAFVNALGDLGPVSIVTMGERPTIVTDYTSSREAILAGIGKLFHRPDSGVTVGEAIFEVSRGLLKRESERAAIVVVSVNGTEHSNLHATRVLEQIAQAGAALHVAMVAPPGQGRFDDESRQRDTIFDRGVRQSGGSRHDVLTSTSLPAALLDVARILTHQFKVVYARPQTLIPPESFEVAAAKPGFTAHGIAARGQPK